jgi:hypothetical protein
MLKNIESVVAKLVGIEKLRVVKNTRFSVRGHKNMNVDAVREGDYAAALALIEQADQNCCGGEIGGETPELFEQEEITTTVQTDLLVESVTTTTTPEITPEQEPEETFEEETEDPETEQEPKEKKPNAFVGFMKKTGRWLGNLVNED